MHSHNLVYIQTIKILLHDILAYFAVSLLCVVTELLDNPKQDPLRILGCQTLTRFIYSQTDGTYTHTIESLVHRVCKLARESGEDHAESIELAAPFCHGSL
ncbi:unnamed protein product [Prunus armeniaca]|uniref:Mon2/Sec7/BIG1-like dimerisation and cyclophilin-binding domain-containing protein n=1 Tax=Prunus armeniaca TaxID=36596 RepID=A0A6J5TUF4_PRUAR|nr:unnamed protein product [Prunus armeniaca]